MSPHVRRFRRGLGRFNARLGRIEVALATIALALLVLANTIAVAGRLFLAFYPSWVIEVSVMLVLYLVFAGSAYLYKAHAHVAVTMLLDRLRPGSVPHRVLTVVGEVLVVVFVLVTLWQAAIYQPILAARATTALQIPQNVVTAMIPLAYASILLAAIESLMAQMLPADEP